MIPNYTFRDAPKQVNQIYMYRRHLRCRLVQLAAHDLVGVLAAEPARIGLEIDTNFLEGRLVHDGLDLLDVPRRALHLAPRRHEHLPNHFLDVRGKVFKGFQKVLP